MCPGANGDFGVPEVRPTTCAVRL